MIDGIEVSSGWLGKNGRKICAHCRREFSGQSFIRPLGTDDFYHTACFYALHPLKDED